MFRQELEEQMLLKQKKQQLLELQDTLTRQMEEKKKIERERFDYNKKCKDVVNQSSMIYKDEMKQKELMEQERKRWYKHELEKQIELQSTNKKPYMTEDERIINRDIIHKIA